MDDNIRNILKQKGTNANLIEWLDFIYPTLVKFISQNNLDAVLAEYEFRLGRKSDIENPITKNLRSIKGDVSGATNLKEKYIQLLIDSYDNIGADCVLSLVHELGHACCPDKENYRLNLTDCGYLNECCIEESYVEILRGFITNDFKIVETSELTANENERKRFVLLNFKDEKTKYYSYTETYSQYQSLYFLIESTLGKDKDLIHELYNAKESGSKEKIIDDIIEKLYENLTYEQIKELYKDIYTGYTCCSNYNEEVGKDDKLNNLRTSCYKENLESQLLENCEKWIEQNPQKVLGDLIEQTGRFTENVIFSRLDNIKKENILDLTRDIAFYINHVDISGNDENQIKLRSYFYSICESFVSKKRINCYNYTREQITGMLLGVFSNRCIESQQILNIKILDPIELKKRVEKFDNNNIAIAIGEEYYQYTVDENEEKNDPFFGLRGKGINNRIIEERKYPDGIIRGNKDYNEYVRVAKNIGIEKEYI